MIREYLVFCSCCGAPNINLDPENISHCIHCGKEDAMNNFLREIRNATQESSQGRNEEAEAESN